MIGFENFHITEGSPIYQQIVRYIRQEVAAGQIVDGDELPSRRVLSALLGVNPNTVQKAYALLEEAGLIRSRSGAKSCMALDAAAVQRIRGQLVESSLRRAIAEWRQLGLSREQALPLLARYWDEEGDAE